MPLARIKCVLLSALKDEHTTAPSDEAAGADGGGGEDTPHEDQVFKRGIVYRGVYCPSLSNRFREEHLELAYQRYSHRQRQKSLIIVNLVDSLLKIVLATVTAAAPCVPNYPPRLCPDVVTASVIRKVLRPATSARPCLVPPVFT
jgi:adenylate cyclase 8